MFDSRNLELLKARESEGCDLYNLLSRVLYAIQFLWVMGVLDSRVCI